jgi:hypothetical protein
MSRVFRSTLVAASLAAALLVDSTAAFADDTTTSLTQAEMTAALNAVATASATAAAPGWKAAVTMAGGSLSGSGSFAVDPADGIAFNQFRFGSDNETEYAVQKKGTYAYFSDASSVAAVKMMGHPSIRYVFTAKASLSLAGYVEDNLPVPSEVLDEGVGAGTKTVHDDGTVDYAYSYSDDGDEVDMTAHVDTTGVLAGASMNGYGLKYTLTYTYGAQKLTVPASVGSATLATAVKYLSMATRVKTAATNGAAHTRKAAKGKKVKVASLRALVRKDAAAVNKSAGLTMVKVTNISGGARVYATNPWTHQTVAYTVKASGKKVILKKV